MSDERREEHTLTSLEVAKLFERSGVPRSQRSVERYCGDGKLDCFHDPDEDRYYATLASVERLIGQMREIQARHGVQGTAATTEGIGGGASGTPPQNDAASGSSAARVRELESELMDLKITNRAKDYFIEEMKKDRQRIADDFKGLVAEYGETKRQIGELQSQVRQLEAPKNEPRPAIPEELGAERVERQPTS